MIQNYKKLIKKNKEDEKMAYIDVNYDPLAEYSPLAIEHGITAGDRGCNPLRYGQPWGFQKQSTDITTMGLPPNVNWLTSVGEHEQSRISRTYNPHGDPVEIAKSLWLAKQIGLKDPGYLGAAAKITTLYGTHSAGLKKLLFLGVGGLVGFLIASMYLKSRKERVNTKNRYGASPFNMTKIKKSIKGGHKERDKDKLSETSLKKMMALGNKLIRDVKTKLNPPSVSGFQTLKYPDKKSYNAEYVKRYRALKPKMSKKSREILDAVEKKAEKKRPNDIDYLSGKLMYAIWEGRWD